MSRSKKLTALFILLLSIVLIFIVACSPAATTATPAPTSTATATLPPLPQATSTVGVVPEQVIEPTESGRLRVIQAAPEIGAVDVYLEQGLIAGRLGSGSFTNPVSIAAGTYYLQVVPAGALPDTQVLADTSLELAPDESLLVLVTGTAEVLNVAVYAEDLSQMSPDQSRLAFLNAVPRGPLISPQIDDTSLDGELDFGQLSTPSLVSMGAHQLAFNSNETLLADLSTALAPQRTYTAVLVGQVGGSDYRILLFNTQVETQGQAQFIHAGRETAPVDVFLDDEPLATNLGYQEASDWSAQQPRAYQIRVMASDIEPEAPPLAEAVFNLGANQAIQMVLLEERGQTALRIFATSLDPTQPSQARLVAVNTVPDAPVAYAIVSNELFDEIPPVTFGTATRAIDLTAGSYDLLWVSSPNPDLESLPVEFTGEFDFLPGTTYTYILTGAERDPFILSEEVGVSEEADALVVVEPEDDEIAPVEVERDVLEVRVVNALAEPLNIRARLDDNEISGDLAFGEASDYVTISPGNYAFRVGAADSSPNGPDFLITDLALQEIGVQVSLYVYGYADTMLVAPIEDFAQPVRPSQAILRVFNAAPGSSPLYISVDIPSMAPTRIPPTEEAQDDDEDRPPGDLAVLPDGGETYESTTFGAGDTTNFIGLPEGAYDIWVYTPGESEAVAIVPRLALDGGTRYDLVLLPGETEGVFDVHMVVSEP